MTPHEAKSIKLTLFSLRYNHGSFVPLRSAWTRWLSRNKAPCTPSCAKGKIPFGHPLCQSVFATIRAKTRSSSPDTLKELLNNCL